jgi:hypothetical protein
MGKSNYIYLGPSLPTLGLKKNTLFRGEELPPKLLQIAIGKPSIRSLFVSTKDLAEVQKNITKRGTLEHKANQEMLEIAKTIPR